MRRILRAGLGLAVVAGLAAGCGDESPTAVGSDLLGADIRTVQIILDAPAFLEGDSAFDRIGSLNQAGFGVVANGFEGELDANVLFQVTRPYQVTYEDADEESQTDSLAAIRGGTLNVIVDSLTEAEGPVVLEVLNLTEDWERGSASWELRYDTAGVSEPWTDPGGTMGSVMGSGVWVSGDTVAITLDSATASVWHDSAGAARGGAVRATTANKRLRIRALSFAFEVVPTGMDTVLTAGSLARTVSVASPDSAPDPGMLRVGGLPVWRSLLHFRDLSNVQVPCETGSTTCTVPVTEVTVNAANVLLVTRAAGGRRPERAMRIEARAVLEAPDVPLTRSPLSGQFGAMLDTLAVAAFRSPPDPDTARVPVTGFVRRNLSPGEDQERLLWLALTAVGERTLFGYGQFGGLASSTPPRLELVVTIPAETVTP